MKALGLVVLEKIFSCFSHCMSMGANDPRGSAIFYTRGMVGRIYIEDHYTMLHTKLQTMKALGRGFVEEDFFYVFPIVSLWELSVAMETSVLIPPGPKPSTTFPPPQRCSLDKI